MPVQVKIEITSFILLVVINGINFQRERALRYLLFLLKPWKISFFVLAIAGLSLLSFFANDPTWDIGLSISMGTSTFLCAPYSLHGIYSLSKNRKLTLNLINPIFLAFFSAGSTYDLYNYFKLGFVPISWLENLILSLIIYFLAGIFWSLEERSGKVSITSFSNWPNPDNSIGKRTLFLAVAPIAIVVAIFFILISL